MKIEELKDKIESNTLDFNTLIFKCNKNNDFIFSQYLDKYVNDNNFSIEIISSLSQLPNTNSLFGDIDNNKVYVYITDKLDEIVNCDLHLWVKCGKILKNVKQKCEQFIVDVPTIETWQIKDYANSVCNNVNEKNIDFLCSVYNDNIYALDNDLQKLSIFNYDVYDDIKSQLAIGLSEFSLFDLSNCILQRDINKLKTIDTSCIDIEPFGLLKVLIDNFKRVIDIQLVKNPTPEYAKVTPKQFWAIKKFSCGHYSAKELEEIYKFLCGIDYSIKSGMLDVNIVVDYIICKILLM